MDATNGRALTEEQLNLLDFNMSQLIAAYRRLRAENEKLRAEVELLERNLSRVTPEY